jgi:hypothetical protein
LWLNFGVRGLEDYFDEFFLVAFLSNFKAQTQYFKVTAFHFTVVEVSFPRGAPPHSQNQFSVRE